MVSPPFLIFLLGLRTTKVEGGGVAGGPLGRECKATAATEFEDVTDSRAVKANQGLQKNDLYCHPFTALKSVTSSNSVAAVSFLAQRSAHAASFDLCRSQPHF